MERPSSAPASGSYFTAFMALVTAAFTTVLVTLRRPKQRDNKEGSSDCKNLGCRKTLQFEGEVDAACCLETSWTQSMPVTCAMVSSLPEEEKTSLKDLLLGNTERNRPSPHVSGSLGTYYYTPEKYPVSPAKEFVDVEEGTGHSREGSAPTETREVVHPVSTTPAKYALPEKLKISVKTVDQKLFNRVNLGNSKRGTVPMLFVREQADGPSPGGFDVHYSGEDTDASSYSPFKDEHHSNTIASHQPNHSIGFNLPANGNYQRLNVEPDIFMKIEDVSPKSWSMSMTPAKTAARPLPKHADVRKLSFSPNPSIGKDRSNSEDDLHSEASDISVLGETSLGATPSVTTPRSVVRRSFRLRENSSNLNNTPRSGLSPSAVRPSSRFQQSPSLFSPAKATALPFKSMNGREYGPTEFTANEKCPATSGGFAPEPLRSHTTPPRHAILFSPASSAKERTARVSRLRANPSMPGISLQRDSFGQPVVNRLR